MQMSSEDDDLNLPRAAINKLIKETLPQVRVSVEARELIVACCNEFIHLVSSEANDICNKHTKKTIMPEHVLSALKSLGFGVYVPECESVLTECKHVALKKRRGSSRLENLGIPEEELLRQQQELFQQAREQQLEEERQEWFQQQMNLQKDPESEAAKQFAFLKQENNL